MLSSSSSLTSQNKGRNRPLLRFFRRKVATDVHQHQHQQHHNKKTSTKTTFKKKKNSLSHKTLRRNGKSHETPVSSPHSSSSQRRRVVSFGRDDDDDNNTTNSNAVVHMILSVKDMTEEEKTSYWYSQKEIGEIRKLAAQEAIKITKEHQTANGNNKNSNNKAATKTKIKSSSSSTKSNPTTTADDYDIILRGLEAVAPILQRTRSSNRNKIWRAVFEEQYSQRVEEGVGIGDYIGSLSYLNFLNEELAQISIAASKKSKRLARKIAQYDASQRM